MSHWVSRWQLGTSWVGVVPVGMGVTGRRASRQTLGVVMAIEVHRGWPRAHWGGRESAWHWG